MKNEPFMDTDKHVIEIAHGTPAFWPLHFHRHGELVCVTNGTIGVELNGFEITLAKGDVMLLSPYTPHSFCPSVGATRWAVTFSPESMGRVGDILLEYHPGTSVLEKKEVDKICPDIQDLLVSMRKGTLSPDPLKYIEAYSKLCSLIHLLLKTMKLLATDSKKNTVFLSAVKLCEEHYSEESFGIDDISESLNVSVSSLRQMFIRNMNMSVKQYITLLRVGNAEKLLRFSDMSVANIALTTGFGTIRTFNRTFLKVRGIVPTAYRISHTNKGEDE